MLGSNEGKAQCWYIAGDSMVKYWSPCGHQHGLICPLIRLYQCDTLPCNSCSCYRTIDLFMEGCSIFSPSLVFIFYFCPYFIYPPKSTRLCHRQMSLSVSTRARAGEPGSYPLSIKRDFLSIMPNTFHHKTCIFWKTSQEINRKKLI